VSRTAMSVLGQKATSPKRSLFAQCGHGATSACRLRLVMPSVTRSKGAGERRVTVTGDTVERRANKIVFHSRNAKGLPACGFRYQAYVPERVRQLTDGDKSPEVSKPLN
jgi:hypothetical protein